MNGLSHAAKWPQHMPPLSHPAKIDPDIFLICAWKRGTMGKHGSIQTRLSRSRTSCFRHGSIATDMAWHVYVCIFIHIGSMLWSTAYPHRMVITALSNGEIRVRKVSTGMRSMQHAPSSASSCPCSSLSAPGALRTITHQYCRSKHDLVRQVTHGAPADGEFWRKG
jgi:hypothetical protein